MQTDTPKTEALCYGLIALCRSGFEKELAGELDLLAQNLGMNGYVRAREGDAYVVYHSVEPVPWSELAPHCNWLSLVFARQVMPWFGRVDDLPERDRATPIVEVAASAGHRFSSLVLETPDTDEAKQQSGFCRRFTPHLKEALTRASLFRVKSQTLPELHVLFTDARTAWLAACLPGQAAPWPMGIPRLRMPREAASRSTLKLAEAILGMLNEEERSVHMRAGQRAIDLGAAPGGWTWQLAHRGLHVTSIDNGPMAESVMATGMVTHLRADGFTWRPPRPVDWLVCDMVEQPSRIASLVAEWVATGRCKRAIFNLKLPMKRRLDAIEQCRSLIHKRVVQAGPYELRIKHLYHDREEVTAFLALKQ